jgi:hypothetical protein
MTSFLLRMWLTGWLWARMAPYVLVTLFIFWLGLAWVTDSVLNYFGWKKPLIEWAKAHHFPVADRPGSP